MECLVLSMYVVINFKGGLLVCVHYVWSVKPLPPPPPKIYFFMWLVSLSHSKLLTRDNMSKRHNVDDMICVFCTELETCNHLFCESVVASADRT
jgi:hypothetical protein